MCVQTLLDIIMPFCAECVCKEGYEETIQKDGGDDERVCTNINDCPYPEEEEYLKLKRSKTAWKPKFQITSPGPHLTASKKNVKKERWADICDDESDDEDEFDQFCRPTTDNSAW